MPGPAANPRTSGQALSWLQAQTLKSDAIWQHRCDGLTGNAYGYAHTGEATAVAHWNSIPRSSRTVTTIVEGAPGGSLIFFAGSINNPAGHVVVCAGDGWCYSNDIVRNGCVDRVKISNVTNGTWHLTPLGYAPPIFPHGSGSSTIPPLNPGSSAVPPGTDPQTADAGSSPATVTDTSAAIPPEIMTAAWWQRGLLLLAGAACFYGAYVIGLGKTTEAVGSILSGTKKSMTGNPYKTPDLTTLKGGQ